MLAECRRAREGRDGNWVLQKEARENTSGFVNVTAKSHSPQKMLWLEFAQEFAVLISVATIPENVYHDNITYV